jgi:hypothetical protein
VNATHLPSGDSLGSVAMRSPNMSSGRAGRGMGDFLEPRTLADWDGGAVVRRRSGGEAATRRSVAATIEGR